MSGLSEIRTEVYDRLKALDPDAGGAMPMTGRFTEAKLFPLDEHSQRSRAFEVLLEIEGRDESLTVGPARWLAVGEVRVRYEQTQPNHRGVSGVPGEARTASSRDAQRVMAALRTPSGWPAAYSPRVRVVRSFVEEVLGEGNAVVALILTVSFTALFIEEVS